MLVLSLKKKARHTLNQRPFNDIPDNVSLHVSINDTKHCENMTASDMRPGNRSVNATEDQEQEHHQKEIHIINMTC